MTLIANDDILGTRVKADAHLLSFNFWRDSTGANPALEEPDDLCGFLLGIYRAEVTDVDNCPVLSFMQ
jgi:hypothetical protein